MNNLGVAVFRRELHELVDAPEWENLKENHPSLLKRIQTIAQRFIPDIASAVVTISELHRHIYSWIDRNIDSVRYKDLAALGVLRNKFNNSNPNSTEFLNLHVLIERRTQQILNSTSIHAFLLDFNGVEPIALPINFVENWLKREFPDFETR